MQSLSELSKSRAASAGPRPVAAARDERIFGPFEARVRCRDAGARRVDAPGALDDVSAADFGLCVPAPVAVGARLFAVAALGRARVALRGVVVSAETLRGGRCRLRVLITHHRFLR
jgi:hypothetical protein